MIRIRIRYFYDDGGEWEFEVMSDKRTKRDVYEIPDYLWEAYCKAREVFFDLERKILEEAGIK